MSDNVKKRIGLGTAYGEAKSKGYTGTQEEFAELMYNITIVGERAEAAKDAAQAAQSAAETAEGNAETAATQAAGSATTASGAASTATQKAGEASTSANNAAASASQSQTYASNAEQSATSASGSASAASGSASAAAGSASAASQSETNAAASATAAAASADAAAESARTLTIDTTLTQAGQAAEAKAVGDEFADLKSQIDQKSPYIIESITDQAIASFSDGADDAPIKSLVVAINPVQKGSGDPSPENVRQITGWTVAKVARTGNNLLPTDFLPQTKNGVTLTVNDDGSVTLNGTATETFTFNPQTNGTLVWDGVSQIWLSGCPEGGNYSNGYSLRADGVSFGYSQTDTGNGVALRSFNSANSIVGQLLKFAIVIRGGAVCNNVTFKPMLNVGVSALPFETYQGNTYDITFPTEIGTVYGGTLDVVSGFLTVNKAMVDLGDFYWVSETDLASGQFRVNQPPIMALGARYDAVSCSILKGVRPKGYSQFEYGEIGLSNSPEVQLLRARAAEFDEATPADVKLFFAGQTLVYELATPQTYQLTPVEVKTLLGQNNVFADTGDVSVEYPADTKMYIDNQITALQALVLENISNS